MGILIESLINEKSNRCNMSIEEGLLTFSEECLDLEMSWNKLYNESLIEEVINLKEEDNTKKEESKDSFFKKAKEFFLKMINSIKTFLKNTFSKVILLFKNTRKIADQANLKIKNATEIKKEFNVNKVTSKFILEFDKKARGVSNGNQDINSVKADLDLLKKNNTDRIENVSEIIVKDYNEALKLGKSAYSGVNTLISTLPIIKKSFDLALKEASKGANSKDAKEIQDKKEEVSKNNMIGKTLLTYGNSLLKTELTCLKKIAANVE